MAEPDRWEEVSVEPQIERAPVPRSSSRRHARLTKADRLRRRRLTALVAAALLVVLVGAGARTLLDDGGGGTPLRPISAVNDGVYVVQPGDTLWSIVERLSPDADPRPLVAELRDRNGGVELQVGDRLDVGDLST